MNLVDSCWWLENLADGIILATAYMHKAVIWTQDADFKGLKDVKYKEII